MNTSRSANAPSAPIRLYTVPEASDVLRICQTNIYGLLRSGALKSVKIGQRRLIPSEALVAFVEGLQAPDSAAADRASSNLRAGDGNA
jgi:excisionase family DNA binding protein